MKFRNSKFALPISKTKKDSGYGSTTQLSLGKCREILCSTGLNYSDEEIELIRDYFYQLAAFGMENMSLDKTSISNNLV